MAMTVIENALETERDSFREAVGKAVKEARGRRLKFRLLITDSFNLNADREMEETEFFDIIAVFETMTRTLLGSIVEQAGFSPSILELWGKRSSAPRKDFRRKVAMLLLDAVVECYADATISKELSDAVDNWDE